MFLCDETRDDFQKYVSVIWKPESYYRKTRMAKTEMISRNMNEIFWKAELTETSTAVK